MPDTIATEDIHEIMRRMGRDAKAAMRDLGVADAATRNAALRAAASSVRNARDELVKANRIDMDTAEAKGLNAAMLDRLLLDDKVIEGMATGLEAIAELNDPIGEVIAQWDRPNGLNISRVRVPLGVIGIIYESRPNVTAEAGGLCLKSGNAAILRGGGFESLPADNVRQLAYWRLSGGEKAGEVKPVADDAAALSDAALDGLKELIAAFDDPAMAYAATPRPARAPRFNDYAHLARILEWGGL